MIVNPKIIIHPAVLFMVVWLSSMFLFWTDLSTLFVRSEFLVDIMIISNIISFFLLSLILKKTSNKFFIEITIDQVNIEYLNKVSRYLVWIWVFAFAINTIYSKGLPIFYYTFGVFGKSYAEYGIPTFAGLSNAIFLVLLMIKYILYLFGKKIKTILVVLFLLLYPILIVNRGLLFWCILELLPIYIVLNSNTKKTKKVLYLFLIAAIVILVFGIVGDLRISNSDYYVDLLDNKGQNNLRNLPSGAIWVYLYLTTPLNNLYYGAIKYSPNYIPYFSVISLIPTFIRDLYYKPGLYALELANSSFNTSTFYAGFVADFGLIGAFISVLLIQLFSIYYYYRMRDRTVYSILKYSVFFQCIVLSVFWNNFTSLVSIFQIILINYIQKKSKFSR